MALALQLNREDTRPLYLQIAAQIKNQISVGRLPPGTRLPSVRQMARILDVNRLTVHNAYSELQADGWVESTVGRGTFVLHQIQPMALLSSVGDQTSADTVLNDLQPIKQIPMLRSLAYSEPDATLAPVDEIWGALAGLRREAASLVRYETHQGDPMLRVELAALTRERGVEVMPDEIIVTSGGMQALSLVTQALARAGDCVLVEQPTYLGLIHILKTYGVNPISIPLDEEGPDLSAVEQVLQRENPCFFYTIPNFHNPTGFVMSPARRRDLLQLAARYHLPVVEDDIYGMMAYDAPPPVPLRAHETDCTVIYISSLSKVLIPGLRIGWIVAPAHLQRRLLSLKLAADLFNTPFVQRAAAHFLHQGRLKVHLRRILPVYRGRRDALLRGLARHMPEGVTWTYPAGGFSSWVTLPQDNMMTIYEAALQRGLAFTPGQAFLAEPGAKRHLRLCFSTQPAEDLDAILALLGDLIREHHDRYELEQMKTPIWTPLA